MLDVSALRFLQSMSRDNYQVAIRASYERGYNRVFTPGTSIEARYEKSLTPLQKKKIVAITLLALSLLAVTAVVVSALRSHNSKIYHGLTPTLLAATGLGIWTGHLYFQIDLDRKKVREKEAADLLAGKRTLPDAVKRLGAERIVGYALLGGPGVQGSMEKYRVTLGYAAALRKQEDLLDLVDKAYWYATAPARYVREGHVAHARAQQVHGATLASEGRRRGGGLGVAMEVGGHMTTMAGQANENEAERVYANTVSPAIQMKAAAKQKIRADFVAVTATSLHTWHEGPGNKEARAPAKPSAPPADPVDPAAPPSYAEATA